MKATRKSKARRLRSRDKIAIPQAALAIRDLRWDPPAMYLLESSLGILQEYELMKLNRGANIRKHVRQLEEQMRMEDADALLARWLIEHRAALVAFVRSKGRMERTAEFDPAIVARWLMDNRNELIELQRIKQIRRAEMDGAKHASFVRRTLEALPAAEGGFSE